MKMIKWTRALYQPNRPLEGRKYVTACDEHIALSASAAAEGMVLLKNEDGVLPLQKGKLIAGFGKGLHDIVKGGGGSGDVYTPFIISVAQGIEKKGGRLYTPLSEYYHKDILRQYQDGQNDLPALSPWWCGQKLSPQDLLGHRSEHGAGGGLP